jgi:nicotinamide-nucleotide amidase
MKIEIITVGNELLSGKTINSNAQYLCKNLFKNGYETHYISVFPDDKVEMQKGIKQALNRANCIIITGGLGPTLDDNTKNIVCDLLRIPLKYRDDIADDIRKRFGEIAFLEEQSTVPKNGYIFKNEVGTAPGFAFIYSGKVIILLPGVPVELESMFNKHALLFIEKHFPLDEKIYQDIINICLLPELEIDAVLRTCPKRDDVILGIYPSHGIVHVTLTTKAKDKDEANKKIKEIKKQILTNLQDYIFLSENGEIEKALHDILCLKDEKIAFAESCSGGALSCRITSVAGSSKYFIGSFITYSNELKKNVLKVSEKTLEEKGAVSIEVVKEMVEGIFTLTDATYAVAISGIAGPSGATSEKPVGMVCMAIGKRNDIIDAGIIYFQGNRELIIKQATNYALSILYRKIAHNLLYFEK